MPRLTLDFETYYDAAAKYSLRSMTTQQYVTDPRFYAQGVALKWWGQAPEWVPAEQIAARLAQIDWSTVDLCGWNLRFDGFILSHHYGRVPRSYIDGMGISRAVLGASLRSHGLDSVSQALGGSGKLDGGAALKAVDGVRVPVGALAEMLGRYGVIDAVRTEENIEKLEPFFPASEFPVLDMYTRMAADPKLRLDPVAIRQALAAVDAKKAETQAAMVESYAQYLPAEKPPTKTDLGSNARFKAVWERLTGIDAPTKFNPKGERILAFAKNDRDFFRQAQAHPLLQAVYKARLSTKSTIEKTRLEKLATHAQIKSAFPVPLNYAGALNTVSRASGADGLNMQNLPHVYEIDNVPQPGLRHCFVAAPGHTLTVADSSGIEFIIAMTLCGQHDVLERRAQGVREYSRMASKIFGFEVNKNDHPKEDKIGKVTVLQSQYQSGGETLATALFAQTSGEVMLTKDEAAHAVRVYRTEFDQVSAFWKRLEGAIAEMCAGIRPKDDDLPFDWFVEKGMAGFILPSGHRVKYADLKFEQVQTRRKDKETGEPLSDAQGNPLYYTRNEATYVDMRKGGVGQVGRAKLYPGKCLAGSAKVLLETSGWTRIDEADPAQRVWDGVEWVHFGRVAAQGEKTVTTFCGVEMTPDHKVLTYGGWKDASQSTRSDRVPCRLPDLDQLPWKQWKELAVERAMRSMRQHNNGRGERGGQAGEARHQGVVRVHEGAEHPGSEHEARHVGAPSLRRVAVDDGQVPTGDAPSLRELWRARHQGVRAVARVREFLGRHGANVAQRRGHRADGQLEGLHPGELPVADAAEELQQPQEQSLHRDAGRHHDDLASGAALQDRAFDTELSGDALRSERVVQTYDLVNCGPRRQFVVLADDGPMIVSNCLENICQALAGTVVNQQLAEIVSHGFQCLLQVHDEGVFHTPLDRAEECYETCVRVMSTPPVWWPELKVGCEADRAPVYGLAK